MTSQAQPRKLDEGYRALIEAAKAAGMPQIGSVTAAELRSYHESMLAKLPPGPAVESVEDCMIPVPEGGVAARIYRPAGLPRALIVYFHGGGWTIGSLDGWDAALRRLALASQCAVVSVDYRLAPEHRFPAAVDDAVAATHWALAGVESIAHAAVPVVVAGDSAGGNLSAVVARILCEEGTHGLAAQILIYPSTDGNIDSDYMRQFESPFLTRDEIAWFFDQYVPDRDQRTDPRFAPLHGPRVDGLPPALVLTAECDLLCDEGEAYAARLQSEGVTVRVRRFEGGIHGFFTMDRGLLPHSGQAMEDIANFLKDVLVHRG
ncbi:alpha/beta hydrolase [Burkholderia multivorans]|uniref:alpha/beta hydrolase n=1 Tax=Burkholderia multivorans TaxID=87883 RepID=UPI001C2128F8|nr:alpha/beta hydrolase [Burkholderia multivorans]MBU9370015.1 alpha/beta hydrolase [Burkholderia multivorans]